MNFYSIFKTAFHIMLVFVVVCLFVAFVCELSSSMYSKIKRKMKKDDTAAESEHDFSIAPALCIDAIHLVSDYSVQNLIRDRIFRVSNDIAETMSQQDQEMVTLLLSSYILFLKREAPYKEQSFPMLMELLNNSKSYSDTERKDTIEYLFDDYVKKAELLPDYYLDYQRYKLACHNKEHILMLCKVIITNVIRKLYGNHFCLSLEIFDAPDVRKVLSLAQIEEASDADAAEVWEVE